MTNLAYNCLEQANFLIVSTSTKIPNSWTGNVIFIETPDVSSVDITLPSAVKDNPLILRFVRTTGSVGSTTISAQPKETITIGELNLGLLKPTNSISSDVGILGASVTLISDGNNWFGVGPAIGWS